MSRFNLIDEKWIPVRMRDGTRDELGIKDTLLRSKEIAGIEDQSPLVVAALHRFLLAVLYRALEGPIDIKEAKDLFKAELPGKKIIAYLGKWEDRFYLFDKKYPFGQNPHVQENEIEPWTKLTSEYNASSNKVLFDHTDTKEPGTREPKECARWLLSTMTFSIAGGRGAVEKAYWDVMPSAKKLIDETPIALGWSTRSFRTSQELLNPLTPGFVEFLRRGLVIAVPCDQFCADFEAVLVS